MPKIIVNYEWMIENNISFTDYCRYLVNEGFSDDYRLEAYRGETLALFTDKISSAAEVQSDGDRWRKYRQERVGKASLMRLNEVPATYLA